MRIARSICLFLFLCAISAAAEDPFAASQALLDAAQHAAASAAARMSLPEIQAAAMLNNPENRAAVRRVSLAQSRVSAAGALDDPMVMYRNWGTPLSRPWAFDQAQNMFMVQQSFPGPGKRGLRSGIAGKEVEIARLELETVRRNVAIRVRKAFYDLLRNADELRVHDQQVALAREGLRSARIKYTVGRVPQQDVLRAQIAITRLAEHLVGLSQEGEMARAILNTLMGRDPATPLEIVGEYSTPPRLPALVDLERIALDNRPELKLVTQQREVAADRIALARKAYTPDYTLSAGYMLMPPEARFRNNYMAEVTVNLPWLNKRKHDSEIKEAESAASVTDAEYEARRAAVFLEIQEALIRAQAAQRSLALYRDTLRPQAEATLQAASAAYQHDRADFLNLIDSQNLILEVQSSYYRVAAELDARLAELELAIGAPVPRDGATLPSAEEKP